MARNPVCKLTDITNLPRGALAMPTELFVFSYSPYPCDFGQLAERLDSKVANIQQAKKRTETEVRGDLANFASTFTLAIENKFRETGGGLYQKLLSLLFGIEEFHCYILIVSNNCVISSDDTVQGEKTKLILRDFVDGLRDYHRTMMTVIIINATIDKKTEEDIDLHIPYSTNSTQNYPDTIVKFHRFRKKIAKQQKDFFLFISSRLVSIGSLALLSAMWIGWVQEISKKALESWEWTKFFFGLTLLFLFIAIMSWRVSFAKLRRTRQSSSDTLKIKKRYFAAGCRKWRDQLGI